MRELERELRSKGLASAGPYLVQDALLDGLIKTEFCLLLLLLLFLSLLM
jgi:hypothetical protein